MLGSATRADSVSYLTHVGYQGLIIDCMAAQGFVYRTRPALRVPNRIARFGGGGLDPVDPDAVESNGLGFNATVAGLVENAREGKPIVLDVSGANDPPRPEYDVPGWNEALTGCDPTEEELNAWLAHPSYDRGLPFMDLVNGILESEPVKELVARYPDCMREAGWPVKDRYELTEQIQDGFENLLVDATASLSEDPAERAAEVDRVVDSAEWSRVEEARARAASADAACRREAHDMAFTALLEPLRRFRVEHLAEIDRLRAEWAAVEERASQAQDPAYR